MTGRSTESDESAMGGGDATLTVSVSGRTVLAGSLERLTLKAQSTDDGVILPFAYQPTTWPEDEDQEPREVVYARLRIEVVPPPSTSAPSWEYGAPMVPVVSGPGRGPCPECAGRGARVLPSASAETECSMCDGTGEKA